MQIRREPGKNHYTNQRLLDKARMTKGNLIKQRTTKWCKLKGSQRESNAQTRSFGGKARKTKTKITE